MSSLRPSSLSSLKSPSLFPFQNRIRNPTFLVSCSNDDKAKLAIERALAYKAALKSNSKANPVISGSDDDRGKLALERAMAYKEANKSKKKPNPGSEEKSEKKEEPMNLTVSSVDFLGLGFAEKKNYTGLPPGLRPIENPYSEDDVPEVEIIVGDPSKFPGGKRSESKAQTAEVKQEKKDGLEELYGPKITTWGASNLSKTVDDDERNIQPEDVLETEEEKDAKEEEETLVTYKMKIGSDVDPKLRAECEKPRGVLPALPVVFLLASQSQKGTPITTLIHPSFNHGMAFLQLPSLSSLNSAALFPTQNRRSSSTFLLYCVNDDERGKLALERAYAYKEAMKSKKKPNPGLEEKSEKKEELKESTVSSVDFMGLGFADKKNYTGLPPGLRPIVDPYSEDDLPEVEIIVGDPSKFPGGKRSKSKAQTAEVRQGTEDGSKEEELYKPKVTTWGADNISNTLEGGRNDQPGDVLETDEEKAAKEEC